MTTLKEILNEKKWSAAVETEWSPPEGFFTKSAEKIAAGLKAKSKDLKQAMSRLNFFINRAGKNLSADDKARLENAKDKLRKLFEEQAIAEAKSNVSYDPVDKATVAELAAVAKQYAGKVATAKEIEAYLLAAFKKGYSAGRASWQ